MKETVVVNRVNCQYLIQFLPLKRVSYESGQDVMKWFDRRRRMAALYPPTYDELVDMTVDHINERVESGELDPDHLHFLQQVRWEVVGKLVKKQISTGRKLHLFFVENPDIYNTIRSGFVFEGQEFGPSRKWPKVVPKELDERNPAHQDYGYTLFGKYGNRDYVIDTLVALVLQDIDLEHPEGKELTLEGTEDYFGDDPIGHPVPKHLRFE